MSGTGSIIGRKRPDKDKQPITKKERKERRMRRKERRMLKYG